MLFLKTNISQGGNAVQRCVQDLLGSLVIAVLKFTAECVTVCQRKNFENQAIFSENMDKSTASPT